MERSPVKHWGRTRLLLSAAALLAGCATVEPKPPVTIDQVVQMSREGVPAADIVQKMRDAGTVYRLSGSQLAKLKGEGVPDEVLDYMQETYLAQARARGALEYGSMWGPTPYWGPYWGPYAGYYPWGPYWGRPYPYHRPYHPRPAQRPRQVR